MKVLLMYEKDTYIVKEITAIWYDNDIYDKPKNPIPGLCMRDVENEVFCIEHMSKQICNDICKTIFNTDKIDLTAYGEYVYL